MQSNFLPHTEQHETIHETWIVQGVHPFTEENRKYVGRSSCVSVLLGKSLSVLYM